MEWVGVGVVKARGFFCFVSTAASRGLSMSQHGTPTEASYEYRTPGMPYEDELSPGVSDKASDDG